MFAEEAGATEIDGGLDAKTPVQLLQEYCDRAGLKSVYEWDTHGDLCQPLFGCRVTVGGITGTGEGPSKRAAKRKAAEAAWEVIGPQAAALYTSRAAAEPPGPNPVGALQELCTSRGLRPPQYTQLDERGPTNAREYTVSCWVEAVEATGTGPAKKAAKREAALKVLAELRGDLQGGGAGPAESVAGPGNNAHCTGTSQDPANQGHS